MMSILRVLSGNHLLFPSISHFDPVLLGDRTSLVNPEFGSRQCAHNELDREMRD